MWFSVSNNITGYYGLCNVGMFVWILTVWRGEVLGIAAQPTGDVIFIISQLWCDLGDRSVLD
jgi:hypothetical protein